VEENAFPLAEMRVSAISSLSALFPMRNTLRPFADVRIRDNIGIIVIAYTQ
jgi:hypothetical protein